MVPVAGSSSVYAQLPKVPRNKLGVDMVSLRSGDRIYGIVTAHEKRAETTVTVERKWFEATYPEAYAEHLKREESLVAKSSKIQLLRLKDWKKLRADDQELVDFIEDEIARVQSVAKDGKQAFPPTKFVRISYTPEEVRRVFLQPDECHQVAGVAWMNQIENVTTTSLTDLKKKLVELDVDVKAEVVDLSSEVTSSHLQSDDEWNARVCVIEYVFGKRLQYQGMGSTLIKIDPEKPADPMALIGKMMQGGVLGGVDSKWMDDVLNGINGVRPDVKKETNWWKKATDGAEKEGCRAVRVTRLTQDISNPVAKVEELFLVEISPGDWVPVFKAIANANRNDVDQAEIDVLKNDPQVEKVMSVFNSIGSGNGQLLDTALRQGVATQQAMTESSNQFFEFLNRYTANTDGPELQLKAGKKTNK